MNTAQPKKNIAVLISGSGSNLQSIINAVDEKKIHGTVALVVSNNAQAFGLKRAEQHGIPALHLSPAQYSDEQYDLKLLELLHTAHIDLVVLAGYLKKIGAPLLTAFNHAVINIHPSLIPSFCGKGFYGRHVHEAAVAYGVRVSGATVHFVDTGMDTGPIILQKSVPVLASDTAHTLADRVLPIEHELLTRAVSLFCDDRLRVTDRRVTILPSAADKTSE